MKIYKYLPGQKTLSDSVVALGLFDGLHIGHRRLLESARRIAEERGLGFAVFTFESESNIKGKSLYTTEQKLALLDDAGVSAAVVAKFSDVSHISAEDFVKNSLLGDLSCRVAVAGRDFRFGKGASGNASLLSDMLSRVGAEFIAEDEHSINGEKISTGKIKELISEGEVDRARELLSVPYFISAYAEHGTGVGHHLGFPTANSSFEGGVTPLKRGVYRTAAEISGELYHALTNVGTCPTFDERPLHAETHVIGYSGDLYGKKIRIFFLGYLRDEIKFNSEKELILQIKVDKNRTIKENGELKWQEIGLNSPLRET